jgi:hypothetical protein
MALVRPGGVLTILVACLALLAGACQRPGAAPVYAGPAVEASPPAGPINGVSWSYEDTRAAIRWYFGPHGQHAVDCADGYTNRESGQWPYSTNGDHYGTWQEHNGFLGSIKAVAASLGRWPDWFDPWQNTGAARMAFDQHGGFTFNWKPVITVASGRCP